MALEEFLILRRPQCGRLEGRTAPIQPNVNSFKNSFSGNDLAAQASLCGSLKGGVIYLYIWSSQMTS
jgi:hypothetical protein